MTKAEVLLREALTASGMVLPVSSSGRGGAVEVLCRGLPGWDKPWLGVVDQLLRAARAAGVEALLARRYLLKDDRMVFGWHVGFSAKSAKALSDGIETVREVLTNATAGASADPPAAPRARRAGSGAPLVHAGPPMPEPRIQQAPVRPAPPGRHPVKAAPRPRAPVYSGPDPVTDVTPRIKRVSAERDPDSGRVTEIFEMPLPHMTGPMNVPNERGRGAGRAGVDVPMILRGKRT